MESAYAYFDCRADARPILEELPTVRKMVECPSELELILRGFAPDDRTILSAALRTYEQQFRAGQVLKDEDAVRALMRQEHLRDVASGTKYVLEGRFHTSRRAADELAAVMNQLYNTPLYVENEPFRGAIVFFERGEYWFQD